MKYYIRIEPKHNDTRLRISDYVAISNQFGLTWWHEAEFDNYCIGYDNEPDLNKYLEHLKTISNDDWCITSGKEFDIVVWGHVKVYHPSFPINKRS